jgi:hypothetical protein
MNRGSEHRNLLGAAHEPLDALCSCSQTGHQWDPDQRINLLAGFFVSTMTSCRSGAINPNSDELTAELIKQLDGQSTTILPVAGRQLR